MTSVRLTQSIRDSILQELLSSRFSETEKLLKKFFANLSDAVYEDVYTDDDIKRMNDLPKGWLPTCTYMHVQFGDPDGYTRLLFKEERRFPKKHVQGCARQYPADHPLSRQYRAYQVDREKLKQNKKELILEIRAVLNSAGTVGKLIEAWPEVRPFAEKFGSCTIKPASRSDREAQQVSEPACRGGSLGSCEF